MTDATAAKFPRRRDEITDGRSIEDCLEEFGPRAQAFADAQTRAALKQINLEADVAALRPAAVETDVRKVYIDNVAHAVATSGEQGKPVRIRRRPDDPRKVFIAVYKAKGLSDLAIAMTFDRSKDAARLAPEPRWVKKTGSRSWAELFNARKNFGDRKLQACVRKFFQRVPAFEARKRLATGDRTRPVNKKETA